MPEIRTKRWNDPIDPGDGTRILVCRYRPRALPKAEETWTEWLPNLGPSKELHAVAYGKGQPPIGWTNYRVRYLAEMKRQRVAINQLAQRVKNGETITLLCASSCEREDRCHRSLLKRLIEAAIGASC